MQAGTLALALLATMGAGDEDVARNQADQQAERLRPLDFAPFEAGLATLQLRPDADAFLIAAEIAELRAALVAGELTSEVITPWHSERIRRLDEGLRGMLELNPAADRVSLPAEAQAQRSEASTQLKLAA
jgi:amidase